MDGIRVVATRELLCLVSVGVIEFAIILSGPARADGSGDPTAVKQIDGKYLDKDGISTYKIQADGTVDWYTYSGYRRYHSECHVCHGPDGEGSSYAPALKNSLKTMSYSEYAAVVAGGRKNVTTAQDNVMPAFGTNKNVACYMDDIFVYLRARANDAWGRMRPAKREDKPKGYTRAEDACFGKE
jgi:methanol metabolism-related c-type cytochrome